MRALVYDAFGLPPAVREVPEPKPARHGVVVQVAATGLCRSDWHGWMGHDPDVRTPHVPGHELAGTVIEVGSDVGRWSIGDRVTVPFVCGCGACGQCVSGNQQVCEAQTQPGFTGWGSFAERVSLDHADENLVRLPEGLSATAAASLGCRFSTAFRAVLDQGGLRGGEWVAVHGCGGVGLSAVMVAAAAGASVVAVDVDVRALEQARRLGAVATVDARSTEDPAAAVREASGGGAHLSLDAYGSLETCVSSIRSLRIRGRHVQVGLLPPALGVPAIPMDLVVGKELRILGSHGMPAHDFPRMLAMVASGALDPGALVRRTISLDEAAVALPAMSTSMSGGVTVIDRF